MAAIAASLVLALTLVGCGSAEQSQSALDPQAKANLDLLQERSAYPFLVIENKGSGKADKVEVQETKTEQKVSVLALEKKVNGQQQVEAPGDTVSLQAGEGAQYQLRSPDAREYTVSWQEEGKSFSRKLTLKPAQKIETH
jgi:hypothetical protein